MVSDIFEESDFLKDEKLNKNARKYRILSTSELSDKANMELSK